ncbi:MAG: hypothetical protein ABW252_25535 [Polyangiales bacterium]
MPFELSHLRSPRTILLCSALALGGVVGCAVQDGEGDDAPTVLHHEGHDHGPTPVAAPVDAGRRLRGDAGPPAPDGCPDTFGAIQATIFDSKSYNCSNASCHGTEGGHIDLRKGFAYDSLLGLGDDQTHAEGDDHAHDHAETLAGFDVLLHDGAHAHVIPGKPEESILYDNLRAKLEGTPTTLGGTPMPLGPGAVTREQLKAVELWIKAGAPRTGFVLGTDEICPPVAQAADAGRP